MVRYFYVWTPFVIVGAIVFLALPWLGLLALLLVALVALPALALAIVVPPYLLARAISHRWHASPRTVVIGSPAVARPARQLQGVNQ